MNLEKIWLKISKLNVLVDGSCLINCAPIEQQNTGKWYFMLMNAGVKFIESNSNICEDTKNLMKHYT